MTAYPEVYIARIKKTQGKVFDKIRDELPDADEKWFIESYMRSEIRELLDEGNPMLAHKPSPELIHAFIKRECGGEYQKGKALEGFTAQWIGEIYALYQWQYNIPSARLIELLPVERMAELYIPLHQVGWDLAVKKINDILHSSIE